MAGKVIHEQCRINATASRAYYAMYYAVLALIAHEKLKVSRHSGIIGIFNRESVRKGKFDKELSRWLREAFDLLQRADYREIFTISFEHAAGVLKNAEKSVAKAKEQFEEP